MNLLLEQNRNVIRSICRFHDSNTDSEDTVQSWHPFSGEYRKMQAKRKLLLKQLNWNYKYYTDVKKGLPWPTIVFKTAVDYCISLPIRNDKSLLAACLKQACLEDVEFSPTEDEICELMQISKTQLFDGIRCIDDFIEKGKIHFKSVDIIRCEISTVFARLYLHNQTPMKECVYELVRIANSNGIRSNIRTKVVGATYILLHQFPSDITLEQLCLFRNVERQAAKAFLKKLETRYYVALAISMGKRLRHL